MSIDVKTDELNRMSSELRQEQFLRLYLQHQLQIEAYVRSLMPNQADAEEILQDVAAVIWRKFEDFQSGTRFDHWACSVAHNHMLYFFRRKNREAMVFGDYVQTMISKEVIQQNDLWPERKEALEKCLKQLPGPDRELLQRRYAASATNRSVAKETGRSETSISRALNRIYTMLLDCIQRRIGSVKEGGRS
jgi:RNA polymerase sigma-70 factor, ECF subfamily